MVDGLIGFDALQDYVQIIGKILVYSKDEMEKNTEGWTKCSCYMYSD